MDCEDPGKRQFLKITAAAGGGLMLGVYLPTVTRANSAAKTSTMQFRPNAWLRIGADDSITVVIDKSEMGQGVTTALPMLIAEELEVPLTRVTFEFAPVAEVYRNPLLRIQATGGSTSIRASWLPLRQAGAAARELLLQAAARQWQVPVEQCRARDGTIVHDASQRQLSYGALTQAAAELPLPQNITLKASSDFRVIGQRVPRLDIDTKVNGQAVFGIDVQRPSMLVAAIAHAPVFGGRVLDWDDATTRTLPGVHKVVSLEQAVAVVADSYWHAQRGLAALNIRWQDGAMAAVNTAIIENGLREALNRQGKLVRNEGRIRSVLSKSEKTLRAEYALPYLAHATMEPMNCTADVQQHRCDIWVPTQGQSGAQETAARLTGLPYAAIHVHTTFLGGGFGRRGEQDFVAQAVQLSQAVKAPVKLIWSREQDMQHDFYRPASLHVLQAAVDDKGLPKAWRHRIVVPSIMSRVITQFAPALMPQWLPHGVKAAASKIASALSGLSADRTAIEGAETMPYRIPHVQVEYVQHDPGVPVGFWRSVGNSHNAFVVENFINELAHAAGQDPYVYRRSLLSHAPRHLRVLDLVVQKAAWHKTSKDFYRGIAVHASYGSYVAQVAEINITADKEIKLKRVVCAVDCGMVVNPDIVEAQMESAIVFGLSAALKGNITLQQGRVQQSNFHDYPIIRMDEMPVLEIYLVSSDAEPGGVGEPGTPPIAPAIAGAVLAATGKPVRRLPISLQEL